MGKMYRNIHTEEVIALSHVEMVGNNPSPIRVWELVDGSRWNDASFFAHWQIVRHEQGGGEGEGHDLAV